jgi:hypothetical protein
MSRSYKQVQMRASPGKVEVYLKLLECAAGNMAIEQANCNASASRAAFLCLSWGCRRTNVIHFMCGVQQLRGPTCYPARAALVGRRDYSSAMQTDCRSPPHCRYRYNWFVRRSLMRIKLYNCSLLVLADPSCNFVKQGQAHFARRFVPIASCGNL